MTIPTRRSYPNRRGRRSRRRAASWVLAASLALAPQALADGSALSLTLEQVLALARERSPRIEQRAALLRGAEAEARRARAGRAPEIDAHASYRHLSDVPDVALTFADGQRRTIFPNITERYQGRVDLAVPLYTAGRIRNAIVAAQRGREAAAHELRLERSDLELEVTVAYWQLAVAREREQVLRQSIASFAAHLTDARHRLQYGLAARNELLSIQVERDAAELDRLEAANAAAIAEANLLRLLDLEPHTRLETADPLGPAPPRAKAGGAEVAELEQLVTQALSSRSERAALEARWAVARATIEAERGSRRPQVSASAGFQYARPNPRVLPLEDQFDDSWDVGLAVSFNLFDGGRRSAAVESAAAQAAALGHRLEQLDRSIRLEVTARHLDVETARSAVDVAESGVIAARENLDVASDRHREGLIPSSERLDAEVQLLRAGLDRATALARLRVAQAQLARALGN